MVQTEACRTCGAHIFSEKVAIFGIAKLYYIKVAKKGAQKYKTSQELRMLSSVTLYCQVKKIVMDSVAQFSES